MKTILTIIFLKSILIFSHAQVLITNEKSSRNINNNAIVELSTSINNKGILLPYVNLISTLKADPFPTHIIGMIVYNQETVINNDLDTSVFPGVYHNDGLVWQKLEVNTPIIGDLKYSASSIDHNGWYLLNGRDVSTLSTKASQKATELGFTKNLPDSKDHFLKNKYSNENLGDFVGKDSFVLTRSNLPKIDLNGMTDEFTHLHKYNEIGAGKINSGSQTNTKNNVDDDGLAKQTSLAGGHSHSFTALSGGEETPIPLEPKFLGAYIFIYLGK
ncbi:hypothetical protein [Empedobacter tilapiae]